MSQLRKSSHRIGTKPGTWALKENLRPKLHLAHALGAGDPAEVRRAERRVRVVEVRPVEQIERLRAELELRPAGLGAPPDEPTGWRITIRAPDDPNKSAAEVFLRDLSLSTSGSYEKFFRADGRTYAHIIDPRTGYPAQGTASVSVMAPRTVDSEAWAKPFFINGRTWTAAHKPANFRVFACDDGKPSTCSWIGPTASAR